MLWSWLSENAELLVNLAAILSGLGTALAGVWWVWSRYVAPWWSRLLGTWDSIDAIRAELALNGGLSLKDAVVRTERAVQSLSLQMSLMQGVQRAMLSNSTKGYYEADPDGRYIWVNRHFLDLVGAQLADVLVNGWAGYVVTDERAKVIAEWNNCVAQDRDFDMTFRIVDADQVPARVRSTARRVKDSSGKTIAWSGTVRELRPPAEGRPEMAASQPAP